MFLTGEIWGKIRHCQLMDLCNEYKLSTFQGTHAFALTITGNQALGGLLSGTETFRDCFISGPLHKV